MIPIIEATDISKYFLDNEGKQKPVLLNVSFSIYSNEFFVIIGPNGCGKSTLINIIAGLLEPTNGKIQFNLSNGNKSPEIAVVFQDFGLFYWKTVYQNIEFGLKAKRIPKAERTPRVYEYINLLGLQGSESKYPHQLSGGMQQRTAIARALVMEPKFLFLDEPFASLDAQTRYLMQEENMEIWAKKDITVVMVTHDIDEAIFMGDRILILSKSPGCAKDIIEVRLPHPRNADARISPEFLKLKSHIWHSIREEGGR